MTLPNATINLVHGFNADGNLVLEAFPQRSGMFRIWRAYDQDQPIGEYCFDLAVAEMRRLGAVKVRVYASAEWNGTDAA